MFFKKTKALKAENLQLAAENSKLIDMCMEKDTIIADAHKENDELRATIADLQVKLEAVEVQKAKKSEAAKKAAKARWAKKKNKD